MVAISKNYVSNGNKDFKSFFKYPVTPQPQERREGVGTEADGDKPRSGGLLLWVTGAPSRPGPSESMQNTAESCPRPGVRGLGICPLPPPRMGCCRSWRCNTPSPSHPDPGHTPSARKRLEQERQGLNVGSHCPRDGLHRPQGGLWGRRWGHGWDTNGLCYSILLCMSLCPILGPQETHGESN